MVDYNIERAAYNRETLPTPKQLSQLVEVALYATKYTSGWTRDYSDYGLSKVHSADIESVSVDYDADFTMTRHRIGGQYRDGHKTGVYTYRLFDSFFTTKPSGDRLKTSVRYLFEWTDDNTLSAERALDYRKPNTHIAKSEYEVENTRVDLPTTANELVTLWGAQESYEQVTAADCDQLTSDLERYYQSLDSLHSRV